MANKHNNLNELFTDIADAIRSKTDSTDTIVADDFPDKIEEIEVGVDTSDATATATDILLGKTAYVNSEMITGTIASQAAKTITPSTSNQTAIAKGKYASGAITVKGDSNLVASNIVDGVSIFGVAGNAEKAKTQATIARSSTGGFGISSGSKSLYDRFSVHQFDGTTLVLKCTKGGTIATNDHIAITLS